MSWWNKNKWKVVIPLLILAVLACAFWFGGNAPGTRGLESDEPSSTPSADASETPTMEIDPQTGKDAYLTDPVPEGMPLPVEPQDAVISDTAFESVTS